MLFAELLFGTIGHTSHPQMKQFKRLLLPTACVLVVTYGIFTTHQIRRLEARVEIGSIVGTPPQVAYAFDDSFVSGRSN